MIRGTGCLEPVRAAARAVCGGPTPRTGPVRITVWVPTDWPALMNEPVSDAAEPASAPTTGIAPQPRPARARTARGRPQAGAAAGASVPRPVLERLFELYPQLFGAHFRPLKLGIFQDLMALHADEFSKDDLKAALGFHARSTRYLESVAAGEKRHDLKGEPVDDVAPEHIHHAIMEVFRRRQTRSKQDLRPWLRDRLVQAIEASGLGREAYAERVRTQDPAALAALDEAFAELASRAARHEALLRAYRGSGRSVEEFADMYGLAPESVREALAAEPAVAPPVAG